MKKSKMMLGSAIMLAVLLVAGGTLAWFTASTEPVVNNFTAGTLEIELVDEFEGAPKVNPGDCYDKEVYVENTGTKKSQVRIKKDIAFSDPSLDLGVVEYELGDNWELIDGYFYYNLVLEEGDKTSPLFAGKKVCFNGPNMDNDYQGAELAITIEAEGIQATNGAPTDSEWALDILTPIVPAP